MNKLIYPLLLVGLCACQVNVTPNPEPTTTPSSNPTATPTASPIPSASPSASTPPATGAVLGQQFSLQGGQAVQIASENLTIRFDRLVQDSRCPSDVQCIRAGDVTVGLQLQQSAGPQTLQLTYGAAPTEATKTYNNYTIALTEVRPISKTSTQTLSLSDYSLTLLVNPQ